MQVTEPNSLPSATWLARRAQLTDYFDRTAAAAWIRLTSTAPVGRVRRTVRAGRDAMRGTLVGWLPADLAGRSVLDAGCGTGQTAAILAGRGARVTAVDVAASLVDIAAGRHPDDAAAGSITWRAGDMLDPALGEFDHVVLMDSLIHYGLEDVVAAVAGIAGRTRVSLLLTFAPRTPLLAAMHAVGRLVPAREHRAPAIVPLPPERLAGRLAAALGDDWAVGRGRRVANGFYISEALELRRR